MRRALFFLVVIFILIGSGFLTIQLSTPGGIQMPGVKVQTSNPDGSVLMMTSEHGSVFLTFAGFVLFNIIGIGVTIAIIMWFLNRSVNQVKSQPNAEFSFSLSPSKPNSIGATLAAHKVVTIGMVIIVLAGAAFTMALFGVFSPH